MSILLKLCCILLLLNNPKNLLDQLPECSEISKNCPENFKLDLYNDVCANMHFEKPDHICNKNADCDKGRYCTKHGFCHDNGYKFEEPDHSCNSDKDCAIGRHCSDFNFCHDTIDYD